MFWGIILKPNKKYTQKVKKAFHLSQAALDINSSSGAVQLFVSQEDSKILIGTLKSDKVEQLSLDLNFSEEETISFQTQGNGSVHLSGYFIDDVDDMYDVADGDEVESDEEVPQLIDPSKLKKIKNKGIAAITTTVKDDDDDDDESDDEDFDAEGGEEEDGEEEGEEEEDDDEADEDDDEDDDEDEEDEVPEPKAKQAKIEKAVQNGLENGQKATKQEKKKEHKQQEQQPKKGGERTLSGGVKVEDVVVGKGDEAKSGKKIAVYYEGRLKSNNKIFDSTKQGNGFKFKLGHGDVIKGWDVGVVGMKVGGKRRITCPPHMAYGGRGAPPAIPPNSTLVFEVELKKVL